MQGDIKMKRILVLILAIAFTAVLFAAPSFGDDIKFTESPKSITLENRQSYVVSWKINRELGDNDYFLIQTRDDETWDWGNVEVVREFNYEIPNYFSDVSYQYRIAFFTEFEECYSDPFTVTWVKPDDITSVELFVPEIEDVPRGSETKPVPVTITNTGKYDLKISYVESGDPEGALDVIENKKLTVLKAGESDSTSYSVKVKSEFSVGGYCGTVALYASNIDEPVLLDVYFSIIDSENAILKLDTDTPVITLRTGASVPSEYKSITVKNAGTGVLENVRIVIEDDSRSVFEIYGPSVDRLGPGNDTGDNFTVALLGGNEPGDYETTVKVYADDVEEPLLITVKGNVYADEEWEKIKDDVKPEKGPDSLANGGGMPVWGTVLIVTGAAAVICGGAAGAVFAVKSKKKKG